VNNWLDNYYTVNYLNNQYFYDIYIEEELCLVFWLGYGQIFALGGIIALE
jgi:hypothetical protein